MSRFGIPVMLLGLSLGLAGCPSAGERCNPNYVEDECAAGTKCVYPTAPMCGVAYCCAVDSDGNLIDKSPNCQPDPTLACAPDGSVDDPMDAGSTD